MSFNYMYKNNIEWSSMRIEYSAQHYSNILVIKYLGLLNLTGSTKKFL